MREIVSIVFLVGLIALLVARALKPLLALIQSAPSSTRSTGARRALYWRHASSLLAMLFLFDVSRWRRHPERGFPWWDVGMHGAILIGVIVVSVIYADQLR